MCLESLTRGNFGLESLIRVNFRLESLIRDFFSLESLIRQKFGSGPQPGKLNTEQKTRNNKFNFVTFSALDRRDVSIIQN